MSNEPNKTPYIALQAMATVDGHNVIFYIREYRGKVYCCGATRPVRILADPPLQAQLSVVTPHWAFAPNAEQRNQLEPVNAVLVCCG